MRWYRAELLPALWPITVTLSGSPPNWPILACTSCRASTCGGMLGGAGLYWAVLCGAGLYWAVLHLVPESLVARHLSGAEGQEAQSSSPVVESDHYQPLVQPPGSWVSPPGQLP